MAISSVLLFMLAALPLIPARGDEADLKLLLDGVSEIHGPGIPGPVCVLGDQAFTVVAGKSGRSRAAIVGAGRVGLGRMVAFGHTGYFGKGSLETADTGVLMVNTVRWVAGKRGDAPRVLVLNAGQLAAFLAAKSFSVSEATVAEAPGRLEAADVVCVSAHSMADEGLRASLLALVRNGGGVIASATGWGWQQLNPGKSLSSDFGGNKLLSNAGLAFSGAMSGKTSKLGFVVAAEESPYLNAGVALTALVAQSKGETKLTKEDVTQATTAVTHAARAIPVGDQLLRPRIEALMDEDVAQVVPTRENPVKAEDGLVRVALALRAEKERSRPAKDVKAHPAALDFPGAVPEGAPRVGRTIAVDTRVPRWHSTGLYAAPGELVTVTVPVAAADKGLAVRIGSHSDGIWRRPGWWRFPEITRRFLLKEATTFGACAFGGLVYIDVPRKCDLGEISVEVANVVPSPFYVHGKTSVDEWRDSIRQRPGPWAEMATDKVIITVPATTVRKLDDPVAPMDFWDRVMDACADLATRDRRRSSPERYVADRQISAGYMHSGYPIMTFLDAAPRFVDVNRLQTKGDWGMFHEMGHNHQHRDWTFGGTGEVTCNLFSLYVLETCCPEAAGHGQANPETVDKNIRGHFEGGHDFGRWKSRPFTALAMYIQLQRAFGWDAYKKVIAGYRDPAVGATPKSDDEKRDQWMVRFSRVVQRDLGPFFEAWGVPTSADARQSISALPAWMPEGFPPALPAD